MHRSTLIKALGGLFLTICILGCKETSSKAKNEDNTSKYSTLSSDSIPNPVGYVNDYDSLLTYEEVSNMTQLIDSIEKATGIQIAIICWNDKTMPQMDFEELNLITANKWGVGSNSKTNGIVFGICRGLRKITIRNGYGIEAVYSNEETKAVIEETIKPFFKENKFYIGIKEGIMRMMIELKGRF